MSRGDGEEWVTGCFTHILSCEQMSREAHQAVRQLEHVVAQADDDELRIAGALLDVVRHDRHILEVCNAHADPGINTYGLDYDLRERVRSQHYTDAHLC